MQTRVAPIAALLADKVALAPMAGITDAPVRRAVAAFGARYTVAEMVNGEWLDSGKAAGRNRARHGGTPFHIMQIAGCRSDDIIRGVELAEAAGAELIDINMGCPAKRVTGGLAGSALMRDLDHAEALIAAAVRAARVPVSVKMRLGWDDDNRNAAALAQRAEQAGASLITVHGRTRAQFYKGRADWAAIRAVRQATRLPLIANGDVTSSIEARACLAASGADAVMIGRGAQGRPWLPAQLIAELAGRTFAVPTLAGRLDGMLALYEGHLRLYGTRVGLRVARKHLAWAMEAITADHGAAADHESLRAQILVSEDPAEVVALISRLPDARAERAA